MQARMKNPAFVLPEAMQAMMALNKAVEAAPGASFVTHKLIHLRASQINGCSVCVDMHAKELKHAGQSDERIISVAAWRETPYYSEPERAALALAEAVTRLADKPEAVSDEVWNEAARHYDETALAALIFSIGQINVWNRLNATVRQMVGTKWA